MKKDLVVREPQKKENQENIFICYKCRNWPILAEEQNHEGPSEYLNDLLIKNLMDYRNKEDEPIYITDANNAIDFMKTLKIPQNKKVYLVKAPGCRLCHNEYIEDIIHYALLSGKCDVKTIQYNLFEKGIFFKEWYIKQHLTHINLFEKIDYKQISDKKIIEEQIASIHQEVLELTKLQNKGDRNRLNELRKLLFTLIDYKTKNFPEDIGNENKPFTKLEDFKSKFLDLTKLEKQ